MSATASEGVEGLSDREIAALVRLSNSDKPCAWIAERMLDIHKTN